MLSVRTEVHHLGAKSLEAPHFGRTSRAAVAECLREFEPCGRHRRYLLGHERGEPVSLPSAGARHVTLVDCYGDQLGCQPGSQLRVYFGSTMGLLWVNFGSPLGQLDPVSW